MKYDAIPEMSADDVEAALQRDQPEDLLIAVLSAALYASDVGWAQGVCARLAKHSDPHVRGNAILGFGHLARVHGHLDASVALPLVNAGLADTHAYVRGQADAAADDLEHFLGWSIDRRPPEDSPIA